MCAERGSTSSSCLRTRCFWSPSSTFNGAVRIHVFLNFANWLILKYKEAPDPPRLVEGGGHGVAWLHVTSGTFPFFCP